MRLAPDQARPGRLLAPFSGVAGLNTRARRKRAPLRGFAREVLRPLAPAIVIWIAGLVLAVLLGDVW